MSIYRVGNSANSVDFDTAYQLASDGDTLIFEKGYKVIKTQGFSFQKSLHLIGEVGVNQVGQRTFHNLLQGVFVISDRVSLTIQNFWLEPANLNDYFFICFENSGLVLETTFYNNHTGNKRRFILSEKNSRIKLQNIETKSSGGDCVSKFLGGSSAEIVDSPKFYSRLEVKQSSLLIENSNLKSYTNLIILAEDDSDVVIKGSTIEYLELERVNQSAILILNSELVLENSRVIQKGMISSISLQDKSRIQSLNNTVSSVFLKNSIMFSSNTMIQDFLSASDYSYVKLNDELKFRSDIENIVNVYLTSDTSLIADKISFQGDNRPTFDISKNSTGVVDKVDYSSTKYDKAMIEIDSSSQLIVQEFISSVANSESGALNQLNALVGLKAAKKMAEQMINQVKANQKRVKKGLRPIKQNLNSVFVGNPGTGKTTVARLLGQALFQEGVIASEEFKFIEASESDLVDFPSPAQKTKELLEQARGGVLFIDEAYTLSRKEGGNFGQEAIDTIMKYMEDYRDEIMIIFAGYTKEMDKFLKTNPGLVSRVPNRFVFEDFTTDEIVEIGENLLEKEQYKLEDKEYYTRKVSQKYSSSIDKSNGRWIRNFNEKLIKEQSHRIIKSNSDDVETILNIDIDAVVNQGSYSDAEIKSDALANLHKLIGIKTAKEQVQAFIYQVEANKKKEELKIAVSDFTLHSLFLGNPGTGKTTVARIIGKVLYQKGLIATSKFIEVSRSDLVGAHIGHTALKTREVLESALGGVLFIDEAYTLYNSSENDFGKEAVDEILKFMEDHRQDIVIIFAGYTNEMNDFLGMNPGLKSRIATVFDFEDYSPEEIVQIGLLGLTEYKIDKNYYSKVVKERYMVTDDKSNGRWIRNFNEKLLLNQTTRLGKSIENGDSIENKDYGIIINEDIDKC